MMNRDTGSSKEDKIVEEVELEIEFSGSGAGPPIRSDVKTENFGILVLESDLPIFLGGRGMRPTPLRYTVFGIAAMYVMTLAHTLARKGEQVSKIFAMASCQVDYSATKRKRERLKVILSVKVKPEKPIEELREVLIQAKNECPIFRGLNIQIHNL